MKKISISLFAITLLLTSLAARAESNGLSTQSGGDIGLSVSSYQYEEPNFMTLKGVKLGLDARATQVLQNDVFIRGEVRYAFGAVDYNSNGTGSASGELDWYIEGRGLVGKDWNITNAVMSAYTGFGYRYLFNDARGISSTGAAGYRRESNYYYLPLGIIHRSALQNQAKLVNTIEFDRLLSGKQFTKLSDAGLGFGDVTNNQSSGFGLKLSAMYEKDNLAIGPYLHYWNIDRSDVALIFQNNALVGAGVEPQNNTVEFGLKVSGHF
jgi:hypothetical protein